MTMRERPILFNAPMVRAILDGRKTQTRRPVKPQPVMQDGWVGGAYWQPKKSPAHGFPERFCIRDIVAMCPLGQPGDRLWLRETHRATDVLGGGIHYAADNLVRTFDGNEPAEAHGMAVTERWRPSIHMPRWASRILLEITDVRVQRVQDIGEADALAEGLATVTKDGTTWKFGIPDADGLPGTDDIGWPWTKWDRDPRKAFATLWNDTYGPDAWDRNDWVWAVTFKRVTT